MLGFVVSHFITSKTKNFQCLFKRRISAGIFEEEKNQSWPYFWSMHWLCIEPLPSNVFQPFHIDYNLSPYNNKVDRSYSLPSTRLNLLNNILPMTRLNVLDTTIRIQIHQNNPNTFYHSYTLKIWLQELLFFHIYNLMLLMSINQCKEKIQACRRKFTSFVSIAFARWERLLDDMQLFSHANVVNIYSKQSRKQSIEQIDIYDVFVEHLY